MIGEIDELLEACFADATQRSQLRHRLESELESRDDPLLFERIRASILRFVVENPQPAFVDVAFELAAADWRDLLMAAGHGGPESHRGWMEETLSRPPRVVLQEPEPEPAEVDDSGWVQCPTCHGRFKLSDGNAWDGVRHLRCLQRLLVAGAS